MTFDSNKILCSIVIRNKQENCDCIKKMDSDDDLLFAMLEITVILSTIAFRKRRQIRRYWVNSYLRSRRHTGRFFTGVSFCETFDGCINN